jgi:hypothetical protein
MSSQILSPTATTYRGGSLFARLATVVFVVMSILFGIGLAATIPV